jgi:peptidoglycan/LPS O-acetylase OafA/YrhL
VPSSAQENSRPIAAASPAPASNHYPALDALRFVLAFWVLTSHFGAAPLFAGADTSNKLVWLVVHGWMRFFYGVPAVIGFFVISGFCIHLPYRRARTLPVGKYYARRYIRILIPVIAALVINRLIGVRDPIFGKHSVLWESVLWSLLCEEIYYAVYPALRLLRMRISWLPILSTSFVAAVILLIVNRHALTWTDAGPISTAVILYPVWLLGCLLAEQTDSLPSFNSRARIWMWRFLAWLGSFACMCLNFFANVPYPLTMLWFGIVAYFWIRNELAYGKNHNPSKLLVFGGAWSYSLYLFHEPAMRVVQKLNLPNFGDMPNWVLATGLILAMSYLFYVLIERPSHKLARMFRTAGVSEKSAAKTPALDAPSPAAVQTALPEP